MKVRRIDFYPDEWLAGTAELRGLDRGIYITICALIYSRGERIHEELLRRHCQEHGNALNAALMRLEKAGKIVRNGLEIGQKRSENELETVQKRLEKLSESGAKGNEIKKVHAATRGLNGHATTTTTTTKASPNGEASPSAVPPSSMERSHARRGTRLAPDWQLDFEDRQYALDRGLDADEVAAAFRDFWHAKAGADACKLDWHATWRNWCRHEPARRPDQMAGGQRPGRDRREPPSDMRAAARAAARFAD